MYSFCNYFFRRLFNFFSLMEAEFFITFSNVVVYHLVSLQFYYNKCLSPLRPLHFLYLLK